MRADVWSQSSVLLWMCTHCYLSHVVFQRKVLMCWSKIFRWSVLFEPNLLQLEDKYLKLCLIISNNFLTVSCDQAFCFYLMYSQRHIRWTRFTSLYLLLDVISSVDVVAVFFVHLFELSMWNICLTQRHYKPYSSEFSRFDAVLFFLLWFTRRGCSSAKIGHSECNRTLRALHCGINVNTVSYHINGRCCGGTDSHHWTTWILTYGRNVTP